MIYIVLSKDDEIEILDKKAKINTDFEKVRHDNEIEFENLKNKNKLEELEKQLQIVQNGGNFK